MDGPGVASPGIVSGRADCCKGLIEEHAFTEKIASPPGRRPKASHEALARDVEKMGAPGKPFAVLSARLTDEKTASPD